MLCQNCKVKEANSHIHSVINGIVKDLYLCSDCAAKIHGKTFANDGIFDLLSAFLSTEKPKTVDTVKCECCGTTFDMISKSGRVGCGNCYKTFARLLEPALVRLHGRTSHIGKRVNSQMSPEFNEEQNIQTETKEQKIEKLQLELQTAIKNEEYEKAAVIRDEINRAKEE